MAWSNQYRQGRRNEFLRGLIPSVNVVRYLVVNGIVHYSQSVQSARHTLTAIHISVILCFCFSTKHFIARNLIFRNSLLTFQCKGFFTKVVLRMTICGLFINNLDEELPFYKPIINIFS